MRLWPILFVALCTLPFAFADHAFARARAHSHRRRPRPAVLARAAMVVDLATGRTLYAKHPDRRLPIASLTKLLTAMVVVDSKRSLIRPSRITNADVDRLKWSRSRLPVGSLLLRRTMLHIALMSSENRAAFALSRDYPGGRAGFVRAMNRKARRLQMRHSRFVDPTGLSPHNVSTARDLTRLARAAYRYRRIRLYSTSHRKLVLGGAGPLMYHNTDPLVHYVAWHVALQKTGFTNEAGHCLIVMTRVHGHMILIVLLGDPSPQAHFQDAIDLRRWLLEGRHR
ncbi:serine hydrolase [Trinickia soli]|uniref:Peptidase S11 n=1 Tax=Trinickia soli TaxID=380675 RepID=A0A2N7VWC6_9BURK|nr:serine hydrolase [Trinickia soli]PMS21454.1 peptidase S11 [Trinickia soli]CAB3698412.1 D-alanyl-D-alanine endopeptidase [Trinickia soli]